MHGIKMSYTRLSIQELRAGKLLSAVSICIESVLCRNAASKERTVCEGQRGPIKMVMQFCLLFLLVFILFEWHAYRAFPILNRQSVGSAKTQEHRTVELLSSLFAAAAQFVQFVLDLSDLTLVQSPNVEHSICP